ncbi:DNA replication and repair protein RecF [Lewinella aquimaris]|uniref:DNA replication and repair protein RecF n=1 Tax=Neolewinella aquimaris TaxID=1835722 RepID=A0A840EAG0_9BACT|nr:DNA replication and repair protein RecF [Neolewinella aquimaris]MBB4078998.1 DNA replication and repair protein RecF [Neolewinella aquimaris]
MHLSHLKLTQFKNYESQHLDFSPRLNCFVGFNGAGKTNLLEAIYYLCMSKGYGSTVDQYSIRHGDRGARIGGTFVLDDEREDRIVVKLRKRQRKVIERNGTAYARISEHVGRYPVVIVTPDDINLVLEGSATRRKLLDNSLSQTDPQYLNHLITYNRLLDNRNARLKELEGHPDHTGLLGVYDAQMEAPAMYIFEKRKEFVDPFTELLTQAYATISGRREEVGLEYKSQLLDTGWETLLAERAEKDRILQRTTGGIHRDELVFTQDEHPLRRVASQGQLKSFVLSLKLAQYRLLERSTNRTPILLLDDIFDKLDHERVKQLLGLVMGSTFGQLFITDTDPERITSLISHDPAVEWQRFLVVDGVARNEAEWKRFLEEE